MSAVSGAVLSTIPEGWNTAGPVTVERIDQWWTESRPLSLPAAAREVVGLAAAYTGMPSWHMSYFLGDSVTPIAVYGETGWLEVGKPLPWHDTICRRMVTRLGPNLAPDLRDFPNYERAPLARQHGIRAYAGVPLLSSASQLLGVLAGFDYQPHEEFPPLAMRTLWVLARLLTTVLSTALAQDVAKVEHDRAIAGERTADMSPGEA